MRSCSVYTEALGKWHTDKHLGSWRIQLRLQSYALIPESTSPWKDLLLSKQVYNHAASQWENVYKHFIALFLGKKPNKPGLAEEFAWHSNGTSKAAAITTLSEHTDKDHLLSWDVSNYIRMRGTADVALLSCFSARCGFDSAGHLPASPPWLYFRALRQAFHAFVGTICGNYVLFFPPGQPVIEHACSWGSVKKGKLAHDCILHRDDAC